MALASCLFPLMYFFFKRTAILAPHQREAAADNLGENTACHAGPACATLAANRP